MLEIDEFWYEVDRVLFDIVSERPDLFDHFTDHGRQRLLVEYE